MSSRDLDQGFDRERILEWLQSVDLHQPASEVCVHHTTCAIHRPCLIKRFIMLIFRSQTKGHPLILINQHLAHARPDSTDPPSPLSPTAGAEEGSSTRPHHGITLSSATATTATHHCTTWLLSRWPSTTGHRTCRHQQQPHFWSVSYSPVESSLQTGI